MTPQEKIEIIEKIVLPIIFLIGGIIGYFAGIYKERANIKWKEQREALKKLDKYLSKLLLVVKQKPHLIKEDIKDVISLLEDSLMFVPKKIRNSFKNFLPNLVSSNEPAKLIYTFRMEIAKELDKCLN